MKGIGGGSMHACTSVLIQFGLVEIFMVVYIRVLGNSSVCHIYLLLKVPYALYMDIIYNKLMVLFKKLLDWTYFISDVYNLIWPFNSIVGGGGQYYVLLLERSVTVRKDVPWVVHGPIPTWTYPQWFTRFPVVHLMQVTKGLADTETRSKVLTF